MALSRRDFFQRGFAEALRDAARAARGAVPRPTPGPAPGVVPRGTPRVEPLLRPPGALPEAEFLTICTRCDECMIACPMQAIRRAGPEHGTERVGTPMIVPGEQPCWLCGDLPCIDVCEPAALLPLASPVDARMGRLRLLEERCFSVQHSYCDVCVERCPIDPKPIAVEKGHAPVIDYHRCTGCGICAWLCPASALEVLPGGMPPPMDVPADTPPDEPLG